MKTTVEELEGRLGALFDRQAEALPAAGREWTGIEYATAPTTRPRTRPRYVLAATAVIPLVMIIAVALIAIGSDDRGSGYGQAPAVGSPFHVETRQVTLDADAFSIEAGGQRFVTASPLDVHSDPGTTEYTTLELEWGEDDVAMRLYVYFTSDGREWWSNEIRTYDGSAQGEWIYYTGEFFRSARGTPFVGDLDLTASDHGVEGRLQFDNLRLEAFRRPAACVNPSGPFALEPGVDRIEMSVGPNVGYGVRVSVLDTASCAPVADQDRFTYRWLVRDPTIVTVTPDGSRADLQSTVGGTTFLHVTAEDPDSGAVVAAVDIEVIARA